MGSRSDAKHVSEIMDTLRKFDVPHEVRVGSAHKSAAYTLSIVEEYNSQGKDIVSIAVAGRSNALGGFVDANTYYPVILAPPYSDRYAGADIFSSLRMPSGIATTVVSEPKMAALAAVKIFALNNPVLSDKLLAYQKEMREKIIRDDEEIRQSGLK